MSRNHNCDRDPSTIEERLGFDESAEQGELWEEMIRFLPINDPNPSHLLSESNEMVMMRE